MTLRLLFSGCAVAAALCFVGRPIASATFQTTTPPNYDPPAGLVRTDFPDWPYPKGLRVPQSPDDGKIYHVPGSTKGFTDTQINRSTSTVDWFPERHPTPPSPVIIGKEGIYRACGECHLIDGSGKPDTANLQNLPVAYFLQQLDDMKNDKRHGSVVHASITSMIPISKKLEAADAKLAAEYFHSVRPTQTVRVVETDLAPVTHPGPHSVQLQDPNGAKEPIGTRIVEVPMSLERTLLRDPTSGFIAYVPKGSVLRGEILVRTGGNGKTFSCAICHGEGLRGKDNFPPLAGHSPTATARQLYDFKSDARQGRDSASMKAAVLNLDDRDITDITAYIASLQP